MVQGVYECRAATRYSFLLIFYLKLFYGCFFILSTIDFCLNVKFLIIVVEFTFEFLIEKLRKKVWTLCIYFITLSIVFCGNIFKMKYIFYVCKLFYGLICFCYKHSITFLTAKHLVPTAKKSAQTSNDSPANVLGRFDKFIIPTRAI